MLNNTLYESNNGLDQDAGQFVSNASPGVEKKKKTRLLVQKGTEHILLHMKDIVLFYTENKIVYVIDRFEKKYWVDNNLSALEAELNSSLFFRVNRQYIISIDYMKSFRVYEKVKIKIEMTSQGADHCIIVSQEMAPSFRKWVYEA